MSKTIFTNWKDVAIGAIGILGLGYGIAMRTRLAKVSERLDASIDDLASNTNVNIPERIIDEAVERAVTNEAKRVVEKATNEALAELKKDIHRTVSDAVEAEYTNISEAVLKEATDAAAKIDVARVRKDVERAAEKIALQTFEANLGGILDKFNSNLDNTSRIYSSIASSMVRPTDSGKEFVFKVN